MVSPRINATEVPVARVAVPKTGRKTPFATGGCLWSTCRPGCRSEGRSEGREEGRAEGREEGRAEGAAEKALSVARSFLAEGIPPETVAKCIGLPLSEEYQAGSRSFFIECQIQPHSNA